MGDTLSSMLFFVVLIFLTFVESLPLSDKEYAIIRKDEKSTKSAKMVEQKIMEIKKVQEQVADDRLDFERLKTDKFNYEYPSDVNSKKNTKKINFQQSYSKNKDKTINGFYDSYEKHNGSEYFDRTHRHKRFSDLGDVEKITAEMSSPELNPWHNSHLEPCSIADRHWCLNDGICVLVRDLNIRTCRCPIKYTGKRCEMIDIDYMISLLTNGIAFSGSQYDIWGK